jgi:hypothetical protein
LRAAAEEFIAGEIRRLYGVEHLQLLEHKNFGLPKEIRFPV